MDLRVQLEAQVETASLLHDRRLPSPGSTSYD